MAADLPSEPFNREEQYLADIAGQPGAEVPPCPWSRKEAYLDAISGRLSTMDDRISALATDLSFKGSVATESALPDDAAVGDTYITEDTGIMYVWVGDDWVAINEGSGGTIETVTIPSTSWVALADSDPYDFSDTVVLSTTIGADSLVELINDQAVLFANHGFAIGSVSGQNVTIYSIGTPSSSVTLKVVVKG